MTSAAETLHIEIMTIFFFVERPEESLSICRNLPGPAIVSKCPEGHLFLLCLSMLFDTHLQVQLWNDDCVGSISLLEGSHFREKALGTIHVWLFLCRRTQYPGKSILFLKELARWLLLWQVWQRRVQSRYHPFKESGAFYKGRQSLLVFFHLQPWTSTGAWPVRNV